MELKTAIEILKYHQEWRLGKRDDMIHEPKVLTEALDIVLSAAEKFRSGAVMHNTCDEIFERAAEIDYYETETKAKHQSKTQPKQ